MFENKKLEGKKMIFAEALNIKKINLCSRSIFKYKIMGVLLHPRY
jgi:hypothetical protein